MGERERLGRDHARGCTLEVRLLNGRTLNRRVDFFAGSLQLPRVNVPDPAFDFRNDVREELVGNPVEVRPLAHSGPARWVE